MIRLKIFRWDPAKEGGPHYSVHNLEESTSVLMALRTIRDTQDDSLAFRDYHCAKGACGSCLIRIDGKPVKGCEMILLAGATYTIEPLEGRKVVKDLVVEEGGDGE